MKKELHNFPESCFGCDGCYYHNDFVKRCSGGCMKSLGNYYCTKGRKHFKLLKGEVWQRRPGRCPIIKEYPIVTGNDEEGA